jgi:hypothetical protein
MGKIAKKPQPPAAPAPAPEEDEDPIWGNALADFFGCEGAQVVVRRRAHGAGGQAGGCGEEARSQASSATGSGYGW